MKVRLFLMMLSGCLCGAAHAQTSVTIYGAIDNGMTYTNNAGGHSQIAQYDGNNNGAQGSRLGFRGNEDLGGGWHAVFTLENGFTTPNGQAQQGGLLIGRQAFAGLGNQWGTVTFGRQYDAVIDYVNPLSAAAQWGGYMTGHANDVDNMILSNRVNNSIKFSSVSFSGLRFGGVYGFGGVPGEVTRNQVWSVGGAYSSGPVHLAVGLLNAKDPNYGFLAGNGNALSPNSVDALGQPNTNNLGAARPTSSGFASAGSEQILVVGGAYDIGATRIGVVYSNTRFRDLGAVAVSGTPTFEPGSSAVFNTVELNAKYNITPVLLVGAAWSWTHVGSPHTTSGTDIDATYNEVSAGVDYFLSPRTDVYWQGVYQHAAGTNSTGASAVASITGLTPSTTNNQIGMRVALRTRF